MKGEVRRLANCGHLTPCGCKMGSACCFSCRMAICVFDMSAAQRVKLSHVSHLVNRACKRPTEKNLTEATGACARFARELVRARDRGVKPSVKPEPVVASAGVCPRCGTALRVEYDDLVCLPCGHREPARGSSFETQGWGPDSEVWLLAHLSPELTRFAAPPLRID